MVEKLSEICWEDTYTARLLVTDIFKKNHGIHPRVPEFFREEIDGASPRGIIRFESIRSPETRELILSVLGCRLLSSAFIGTALPELRLEDTTVSKLEELGKISTECNTYDCRASLENALMAFTIESLSKPAQKK